MGPDMRCTIFLHRPATSFLSRRCGPEVGQGTDIGKYPLLPNGRMRRRTNGCEPLVVALIAETRICPRVPVQFHPVEKMHEQMVFRPGGHSSAERLPQVPHAGIEKILCRTP